MNRQAQLLFGGLHHVLLPRLRSCIARMLLRHPSHLSHVRSPVTLSPPIHLTTSPQDRQQIIEVGHYGLQQEVEQLKRDKNVLMQEVIRLRQQQQVRWRAAACFTSLASCGSRSHGAMCWGPMGAVHALQAHSAPANPTIDRLPRPPCPFTHPCRTPTRCWLTCRTGWSCRSSGSSR